MAEIIAYCGLVCNECPGYIATINDDDKKRSEVAKMWSEEYGGEMKTEDINCLGCTSGDEVLLDYAKNACAIRECGIEKDVENCAFCDSYEECDKIGEFHKVVPLAKAKLDELREG
jgi:hypothetical protein